MVRQKVYAVESRTPLGLAFIILGVTSVGFAGAIDLNITLITFGGLAFLYVGFEVLALPPSHRLKYILEFIEEQQKRR